MLKVIGPRRILMLGVLVAANAALAAGVYTYLIPQNETLERSLRQTKGNIAQKRSETDRLQTEYQQIQEQRVSFENLKQSGFLGHQDRIMVRDRMEAVQSYSRVLSARYNIMPVTVEENTYAAQSNQVLLTSRMDAEVEALDDIDFYSFVYWLENGFPGHIMVSNIEIRRQNDVNDVTLRQIGTGSRMVMVRGKLNFEWRTMVPREEAGPNLAERF